MDAEAAYQEIVERGGRVADAMRSFRTFMSHSDIMAYLAGALHDAKENSMDHNNKFHPNLTPLIQTRRMIADATIYFARDEISTAQAG